MSPDHTNEIRTLAASQRDHVDERALPFVYGLVAFDVPALCNEIDRYRQALRDIDGALSGMRRTIDAGFTPDVTGIHGLRQYVQRHLAWDEPDTTT